MCQDNVSKSPHDMHSWVEDFVFVCMSNTYQYEVSRGNRRVGAKMAAIWWDDIDGRGGHVGAVNRSHEERRRQLTPSNNASRGNRWPSSMRATPSKERKSEELWPRLTVGGACPHVPGEADG